jgi:hypothetical protein
MEHSQYLEMRRLDMIAFRKATKGMLCDDIYIHMWSLIRKEFEEYSQIPPDYSDQYYQKWYKNDKLHRDYDLPAFKAFGCLIWYQNGEKNRSYDLPAAVIHGPNILYNHYAWYNKDVYHRDDGKPAIICADESKFWYTNGKLTAFFKNGELRKL